MSKKSNVITLRVSDELAKKIAEAVQKSGRDQADLLREAVDLGMDDLFMVGLDPMIAAKKEIAALKQQAAKLDPAPLKSVPDSAKTPQPKRA
jgi:predicted DNA-binding protein